VNIRLMTPEDYNDVYALWNGMDGIGLNQVDDSRQGIIRYLRRNPSTCFVAESGGRIVGAILSGHDGRRGFIYHAAVAQPERGKGIGRLLTNRVLEALKKEGIRKVALVAFGQNADANAFWEKQGFTARPDLCYRNRALDEPTER